MRAHPQVRHLAEPSRGDVITFRATVAGTVSLRYAFDPATEPLWLEEGCEVLASTVRGALLVRYRCSDDDHLYEGWVGLDAVTVMGQMVA